MASKTMLNQGVALITGAASGIGKEIGLSFAEAGARAVVFADLNETGARKAAEESAKFAINSQYRALALRVDVTDEASVQSMVDMTVREFGRIDYSVNSAGIGNISLAVTPNLDVDAFSKTMETNVKGVMLCLRAVTKIMAQQEPLEHTSARHGTTRSLGKGCIVNVGSVNSYAPAPGMMSYTTSKHALIGLTKSATMDCLRKHIRVNTVCPSWVDTPMMQASMARVPQLGELIKKVSPLQRVATVEEVSDYVVFLCSPSASYINGTGLIIDAGATLTVHTA